MSDTSREAVHSEAHEDQDIQDTVLSIYAQCWDEYHRWKRRDSAMVLASLSGGKEPFEPLVNDEEPIPSAGRQPLWPSSSSMEDEEDDELAHSTTITRIIDVFTSPERVASLNRGISDLPRPHKTRQLARASRIQLDTMCTVTQTEWFEPLPTYENCTLYESGSAQMDDADLAYLDFVPFADEPDFDKEEYCSAFELLWETDTWERDPDIDIIQAEAVRRLHHMGLSFEEIESAKILPRPVIVGSYHPCISHIMSGRDIPQWPAYIESDLPELPNAYSYQSTDLYSRLLCQINLMCSNLSCVRPSCATHHRVKSRPLPDLRPRLADPETTSEVKSTSCSLACYKNGQDDVGALSWTDEELDDLLTILRTMDLGPCHTAVMCDKPCNEVYTHMRDFLTQVDGAGDDNIQKEEDEEEPVFRSVDDRVPVGSCDHEGPCTDTRGCVCLSAGVHCERGCLCPDACKRRHPGCTCSVSKQGRKSLCRTSKCPCFDSVRECDPEKCGPCGARGAVSFLVYYQTIDYALADEHSLCQNVALQKGWQKRTIVKSSPWGFGLFCHEPINEGDLVGEYRGELISSIRAINSEFKQNYNCRNYLFNLDSGYVVDASQSGNATRFLNHAKKRKANCTARVVLVNGDHRIGLYANRPVQVGKELMFNYGDKFFSEE